MEAKELKLGLTAKKKKKVIRGFEVREGRAAKGFKDFGKEECLLHLPFPRRLCWLHGNQERALI